MVVGDPSEIGARTGVDRRICLKTVAEDVGNTPRRNSSDVVTAGSVRAIEWATAVTLFPATINIRSTPNTSTQY